MYKSAYVSAVATQGGLNLVEAPVKEGYFSQGKISVLRGWGFVRTRAIQMDRLAAIPRRQPMVSTFVFKATFMWGEN